MCSTPSAAAAQAVQVFQGAGVRGGAQRFQSRGGGVGAGQAGDGVPGRDELGDDGGSGQSGTAGDEDVHEVLSRLGQ
jgi:hypothetical protein